MKLRVDPLTGLPAFVETRVITRGGGLGGLPAATADNLYVQRPSSSTDNAIARFDGTDGKKIQNSTVLVSDLGDVILENAGRIRNASSTQMNVGFFSDTGPGFELYKFNHATRPGEFSMVYGGAPSQGTMEFIQYDGTNFNRVLVVSTALHVGLGTSAPQQRLHVVQANGTGDVATQIQNNSNTDGETTTLQFVNSTNPANIGGRVQTRRVDTNTASIHIAQRLGGALVDVIDITSAAIVLNETGRDTDVRIEGDTDANLFFTDAGNDRVGVGTSTPSSKLSVSGSLSLPIATITSATTLTASHHTILANANSASFTVTLPAASGCTGRVYVIKKIDSSSNGVTIDGNASETIDGGLTQSLTTQYDSYTIQSDGTAWFIL